MTIRTIEYLLNRFGSGKSPGSADYVDLIDTLADDRNAVYFSTTAPEDTGANPVWFNPSTNVLSFYINEAWSDIDLSLKAPLTSPTFTGIPIAPTADAGTNTTQIATTEFVGTAVSNLVDTAPAALDTLNELAAALGDDANFSTTVTNSLADKVSKSGGDTVTPSTASTVGLIIKGATSQTANLQQWQDSSGTVLAYVDNVGKVAINALTINLLNAGHVGASYGIGALEVKRTAFFDTGNAANVGIIVRSRASQSANLQEWQNSSGTADTSINSTGRLSVRTTLADAALNVGAPSAATVNAIIRGAASQTADLQQWQNSSGTVLNRINSSGHLIASSRSVFGGATSIVSGMIVAAVSQEAAAVPILAKGSASQTANLTEWQNSSGTVLARVSSGGAIVTSAVGVFGSQSAINNSQLTVLNQNSSYPAITVKAAASQSANIQEWQNSAATVLAKVDASGYLWTPTHNVATQGTWTGAVTLTQSDSLATYIKKQLTGNTVVTVDAGIADKTYNCTLELQQDATGSRTIILKGCRTAYGVPLVLTTNANAIDIVRLEWNGTYWTAFMGAAQISVPSAWV